MPHLIAPRFIGPAQGGGGYQVDYSCRFNALEGTRLIRRPTATGDRQIWTLSLWVKRCSFGTLQWIFGAGDDAGGSDNAALFFNTSDQVAFYYGVLGTPGSNQGEERNTVAVFRDPSAWYHIVWAVDTTLSDANKANRSLLYVNGILQEATVTYGSNNVANYNTQVNASGVANYFGDYNPITTHFLNGYISEACLIDGEQLTASSFGEFDSFGVWRPKNLSGLPFGTDGFWLDFASTFESLGTTSLGASDFSFGDTGSFSWSGSNITANAIDKNVRTTDSFIAEGEDFDFRFTGPGTTPNPTFGFASSGTATGTQLPTTSNPIVYAKDGTAGTIGWQNNNGTLDGAAKANGWTINKDIQLSRRRQTFYGYIDGVLDRTFTGTATYWAGKFFVGCAGTASGWTLNAVSVTRYVGLGKDVSGEGNNFGAINLVPADQILDTPTTNWATLNPLWLPVNASASVLSDGNLVWTAGSSTSFAYSTIKVPSTGKWQVDTKVEATYTGTFLGLTGTMRTATGSDLGGLADEYVWRAGNQTKINNGSAMSYGSSISAGDWLTLLYDADAGTLAFLLNGTAQGVAFSGIPATGYFVGIDAASPQIFTADFGQSGFTYPQSGFKALNTANLPTSAIKDGTANYQATLYGGTGTNQTITQSGNSEFEPDLIWIKDRTNAASHNTYDIVRGVNRALQTNNTDAELTAYSDLLTAFNSNGFSLGADASVHNVNVSGHDYVAWQWKANGAGSSNTAGSITSTVSANAAAGFSVVGYNGNGTAGATVGHGLSAAPGLIILKRRDDAGYSWSVGNDAIGWTKEMVLDTAAAATTNANAWNNTAPGSQVFTVGTSGNHNASGKTYVAYCFTEIAGYSKIGSYIGNGSTDGPFLYFGFKPAYILVKKTDGIESWIVYDSQRSPYNIPTLRLLPDTTDTESSAVPTAYADFLANGIKIRSTILNPSGSLYIYAAFAEYPFGGANTTPAPAR